MLTALDLLAVIIALTASITLIVTTAIRNAQMQREIEHLRRKITCLKQAQNHGQ